MSLLKSVFEKYEKFRNRPTVRVITLDVHPAARNSVENVLDVSDHRQRWSAIADMYRGATALSQRNETFEQTIKRLKLTDQALAERRHELVIEHRIWMAFALVELLVAMMLTEGVIAALLCTAFAVCSILQACQRAIRVKQIDQRCFLPASEFLKSPEYWFI